MTPTTPSLKDRIDLDARIKHCEKCALCATRKNVVIHRGSMIAPLWFVGEAPGEEEDEQGLAFVGRAGSLLDACIQKAEIEDYNLLNVIKCRPPDNRNPTEDEVNACLPWLIEQYKLYKPKIIVAMGRYAIGVFRGYSWNHTIRMRVTPEVGTPFRTQRGRLVFPVFHPAYLLRNGAVTPDFIKSLIQVRKTLNKF